jgi:hypothetical protein
MAQTVNKVKWDNVIKIKPNNYNIIIYFLCNVFLEKNERRTKIYHAYSKNKR